jgi:hypothetical protein
LLQGSFNARAKKQQIYENPPMWGGGRRPLAAGIWLLATGYLLLNTGWMRVADRLREQSSENHIYHNKSVARKGWSEDLVMYQKEETG